jgi:hypothetical protein
MGIKEKLEICADKTRFTLFKEGLFYKCYNEDAMVFVHNVKEYKISAKFVKSVGKNVYSIGFPASEVEKEHLSFDIISEKIDAKSYEIKDKHIFFLLGNTSAKGDYNEWSGTIQEDKNVVAAKDPTLVYEPGLGIDGIICMIKNFDLANSTPMQGLTFIQQLKMEIHKVEENNGNI